MIYNTMPPIQTPSFHYVCKLCTKSFHNVDQLMAHSKLKHLKEFQKIKHIVFEQKFIEIETKTVKIQEAKSSVFEKSLPPFVLIQPLTLTELSALRRPKTKSLQNEKRKKKFIVRSESQDVSSSEDTYVRIVSNNKKSHRKYKQVKGSKGGAKPELSFDLIKSAFDVDLTDSQITRLVQADEIVALPNPYIRLTQLTPKELHSKLGSSGFSETRMSSLTSALTLASRKQSSSADAELRRFVKAKRTSSQQKAVLHDDTEVSNDFSSDDEMSSDRNDDDIGHLESHSSSVSSKVSTEDSRDSLYCNSGSEDESDSSKTSDDTDSDVDSVAIISMSHRPSVTRAMLKKASPKSRNFRESRNRRQLK